MDRFIQKTLQTLCDPIPPTSPPQEEGGSCALVTLTTASIYATGRRRILISSLEAGLKTWHWQLRAGQGQPWQQGQRSGSGAGGSGSSLRSPPSLREKPPPRPRGNPDTHDGPQNLCQAEFAGATSGPQQTASPSNSRKLPQWNYIWNRNNYELEITFRKWPRMSK